MFSLGIFITLAVSLASGLFLWARSYVGAQTDDRDDCPSAWEIDDDAYLAPEIRAALHPVNIEEMPFRDPTMDNRARAKGGGA